MMYTCTSGKFVTVHESYRKLHLSGDTRFLVFVKCDKREFDESWFRSEAYTF